MIKLSAPRWQVIRTFILVIVIAYFPLFLHLDSHGLHMWDEARLATSALEMTQSANWLIPTYENKPDDWNTKPPFMIILQALCMKLLGYNELAVRLPAALAGLVTTLLILFIFIRYLDNIDLGIIASLVLVTTPGYVGYHVTRNGDYDALMVFWILLYSLQAWLYFENQKTIHLIYCAIAIAIAIWTKGIQALVILPALVIYGLAVTDFRKITFALKIQIRFALAILFGLLLGLAYYTYRFIVTPEYINWVIHNEIKDRFFGLADNNLPSSPFYYWSLLWKSQFQPYIFYLPLSVVLFFLQLERKTSLTRLYLLSAILSIFYLWVISKSQTHKEWYDAPLFPFLAILITIGLGKPILQLPAKVFNNRYRELSNWLIALGIVVQPYYIRIDEALHKPIADWYQIHYGPYMKELSKQQPNLKSYTIYYQDYNSTLQFYSRAYPLNDPTYKIKLVHLNKEQLKAYDFPIFLNVIVYEYYIKNHIEENYEFDLLHEKNGFKTYFIKQKKPKLMPIEEKK